MGFPGLNSTDEQENASSVSGALTTEALDVLSAQIAALQPAIYTGFSLGGVSWSSVTWTGIHNAAALTDVFTTGITKVDSTFTFAKAGKYLALIMLASPTASNHQVGVRMRDTVNGATDFSGLININGSGSVTSTVVGSITIAANGDTRELQYVKAGITAAPTLAAQTYNGEAIQLVQVAIIKVSQ